MVGLTRQGVVCEACGFACHLGCCDKVPVICPVPADQSNDLFDTNNNFFSRAYLLNDVKRCFLV